MNIWVIGEGVLLFVLVLAWWQRERLAGRFEIVLMGVCALLLATSLFQSVVDGPSPVVLGLGALAMTLFGIEIVRQIRHARRRQG